MRWQDYKQSQSSPYSCSGRRVVAEGEYYTFTENLS